MDQISPSPQTEAPRSQPAQPCAQTNPPPHEPPISPTPPHALATKPTRRETRRARIAQGLCADCGRPRQGSTPEEVRALRLASLLQGRAPYPLPHPPTATRCSACAGSHHRADAARRDAAALARWGSPPSRPRRAPDALTLHSVKTLRIPLNDITLKAVTELKRRDRDAAIAAGKPYGPGQVSRIVRETLRLWRQKSGGYRPGAAWFSLRQVNLHFRIDAETLAIVDREAAAHFNGSRSATVRAMLIATANPPVQARTAPRTLPRRPE